MRRPRAFSTSATSLTAASAPAITTDRGPFTAATDTNAASSNGTTSSSAASTATIAPPEGNSCINRPRAVTRAHASSSDNTPATCAAAISPTE